MAILAVPGPARGEGLTPGGYGWPLRPRPEVVRGFDPPAKRWLAGHRGVDLAAATGAPVFSAGSGVVRFAGVVAGKPVVSVMHPDGVLTTYEPVAATVSVGTAVVRGTPLGTLDGVHPGCADACLHWGARRGSGSAARYLNPLALLGVVRVRLKPVGDVVAATPVGPQARGWA
ncbi:murein hydrolase activator EnvC family protein [Williamsia sp. MIQD14]|uniref:murein hydrolase activator EnvC family protein n=1 Tax=Williamsia sp. MIQD14 TaxID=3425703 RepID=UPI003D9FE2B5